MKLNNLEQMNLYFRPNPELFCDRIFLQDSFLSGNHKNSGKTPRNRKRKKR